MRAPRERVRARARRARPPPRTGSSHRTPTRCGATPGSTSATGRSSCACRTRTAATTRCRWSTCGRTCSPPWVRARTGCSSGAYASSRPRGAAPRCRRGVLPVAAPTRMVRIAGLTQVDGDVGRAEAHAIQDGFRLAPRRRRRAGAPARPDARQRPRSRTPPVGQVERMDAADLLRRARAAHARQPAAPRGPADGRADPPRSGCSTTATESWQALDADTRARDRARHARAGSSASWPRRRRRRASRSASWRIRYGLGQFGTDYLARAAAACAGLEAGPAADELPALLQLDADGRPLWGGNRYLLRFPPGGQPPVHGFWTLTTYDDRQSLVDNPDGPLLDRRLDRPRARRRRLAAGRHPAPAPGGRSPAQLAAGPARPVQPPAAPDLAAARGARPQLDAAGRAPHRLSRVAQGDHPVRRMPGRAAVHSLGFFVSPHRGRGKPRGPGRGARVERNADVPLAGLLGIADPPS